MADYLSNPNAVLQDENVAWRYGKPPDYSTTRAYFEDTKRSQHSKGSIEEIVQNLVKNWEIEASFKTRLSDWRTVNHEKYSFAMNGGKPQQADYMLQAGTYNAIIPPNEYYSPRTSDFASSHKTFKRMMPSFAWEVLEVYSGPPVVAFKWRHWGVMKNDYVGFNDQDEKITAKAHGGMIDIEGVTVAVVDDQVRVTKLETWFDPLEMFRQIAPGGVVNRQAMPKRTTASDLAQVQIDAAGNSNSEEEHFDDKAVDLSQKSQAMKDDDRDEEGPSSAATMPTSLNTAFDTDEKKNFEEAVKPSSGEAVAAPSDNVETRAMHEEMSKITRAECPFMNKESGADS